MSPLSADEIMSGLMFEALDAIHELQKNQTAKVSGEDGDYWHACTDCERSVEESWKYCPFCGAKLEWK